MDDALKKEISSILEKAELEAKVRTELTFCLYPVLLAMVRERTFYGMGSEISAKLTGGFLESKLREAKAYAEGLEREMLVTIAPFDLQRYAIGIVEGMIEYIASADREHIPQFRDYEPLISGAQNKKAPQDSYVYQKILLKAANNVLEELKEGMAKEEYLMQIC